jgi:arylformamidase
MNLNDSAWLERMYNNRALVPDFADHLARWQAQGQKARRELPCHLNLPYGTPDGQTLDVFPAERAGAPVAVFIHGGYWRSLSKSDHSFVAPALHALGATVVVPDYALCPAVTIPQITLQMAQALAWTWRNARRFHGDPSRITVIGHSAGGHLAAMLLTCQWQAVDAALPPQVLRNALGISGLYDLEPMARTPFLQADLRLTPADVQRASPAYLPAPEQGQLYCVAGGDESAEFLRHKRLIQQAWGTQAVPLSEALPGLNHFSIMQALTQPGTRMHALAAQVLT